MGGFVVKQVGARITGSGLSPARGQGLLGFSGFIRLEGAVQGRFRVRVTLVSAGPSQTLAINSRLRARDAPARWPWRSAAAGARPPSIWGRAHAPWRSASPGIQQGLEVNKGRNRYAPYYLRHERPKVNASYGRPTAIMYPIMLPDSWAIQRGVLRGTGPRLNVRPRREQQSPL